MWEVISAILSLEPVQGAIVAILIMLLGWLFVRHNWTKKIFDLVVEAHDFAEAQGLLHNLKGYEKWKPFFDKFVALYREKFGKDASPYVRGVAVRLNEKYISEINRQRDIDRKVKDSL